MLYKISNKSNRNTLWALRKYIYCPVLLAHAIASRNQLLYFVGFPLQAADKWNTPFIDVWFSNTDLFSLSLNGFLEVVIWDNDKKLRKKNWDSEGKGVENVSCVAP